MHPRVHYMLPLSDIEDYNEIYSSLRELSADWEDIGIHLGIKKNTLDKIRADFSKCDKRLSELLAVWLRRNTLNHPLPSWKNLCIALSKIDRSRAEKIGSEHPCACIECLTGSDYNINVENYIIERLFIGTMYI